MSSERIIDALLNILALEFLVSLDEMYMNIKYHGFSWISGRLNKFHKKLSK